jgi:transposase
MTSAEPRRRSIYGKDIAIRVVWQRLGMDLPFRDIAKRLQIGVGSAYRLYRRYILTGEFSPSKRSSRPSVRKLDEHHELYIIGLLIVNPGLYLTEMCAKVKGATGVSVSGPTVCRLLKRNGYTRKKIVQVAKQRCEQYRGTFMAQVLLYPVEYFVWVDETGSDRRDHIRKFGYQIRGLTPVILAEVPVYPP